MGLELADWNDVQKVLKETHVLWSPGLTRSQYSQYIWLQINQAWSRRNLRFFVFRRRSRIVSSCKVYRLEMVRRGETYRFAGLGALYTTEMERGKGYAQGMIRELIDVARSDGCDGVLLFSDIGAEFYQRSGFGALRSRDFVSDLSLVDSSRALSKTRPVAGQPGSLPLASLDNVLVKQMEIADIDVIDRHYKRWLRARPFGIKRSSSYWAIKILRESYLHQFSSWGWPHLQLLSLEASSSRGGYAIFEHSGTTLRVLEAIADSSSYHEIWESLIQLAIDKRLQQIRGWEGISPPGMLSVRLVERSWGTPMVLALKQGVRSWLDRSPCPILELDHL